MKKIPRTFAYVGFFLYLCSRKGLKNMIGIFNDNFPPILDGVALTAQNYAYWLHEKGHDVRVITDYAPNMKEVIQAAPYPINFVPSVPIPFRHLPSSDAIVRLWFV